VARGVVHAAGLSAFGVSVGGPALRDSMQGDSRSFGCRIGALPMRPLAVVKGGTAKEQGSSWFQWLGK
jgi:hypothetical protein